MRRRVPSLEDAGRRAKWRAAQAIVGRLGGVAEVVAHFEGPPRRHELAEAGTWTDVAEEALAAQGLKVEAGRREVQRVMSALAQRIAGTEGRYPERFGLADATLELLALLCWNDEIRSVVETGVADGRTSFVLLHAIRGREGRLASIEIASDVGALVDDRTGWDLRITDGSPAATRRVVSELEPLDLFLHDSDHAYRCQRSELDIGWRALRPGGWLVCDDADWSYASLDFVSAAGVRPSMLHNARTVAMVVRKPTA